MTRYSSWVLSLLLLAGCAVGIDPPPPTEVVFLEGGTFEMGTRAVDPCSRFSLESCGGLMCDIIMTANDTVESERIAHPLSVSGFCLEEHEVTMDQYRHCVARGDCPRPVVSNAGNDLRGGDDSFIARYWNDPERYGDHPVVGVSWAGAHSYCRFRGGRLPTEVEWEFAARSRGEGQGQGEYIWTEPDLAKNIGIGCGDYQGLLAIGPCSQTVRPVKTSPADVTAQGIHDLAANVAEWTADLWSPLSYCAETQPNGTALADLFTIDSRGRVYPVPNENLLLAQDEMCLKINDEMTDYSGKRRSDFYDCARLRREDGDQVAETASACFAAFDDESCLADGVLTVCGRRADGDGLCAPTPWCVPRTEAPQAVVPASLTDESSAQFVVRGAHFQSTQACEARATARRPERLGDPLIGFRCQLAEDHPRCRDAKPGR